MSNQINDGGPAFAAPTSKDFYTPTGMSLRDWFAGQTLSTVIAELDIDSERAAELAYKYADALLKAREVKS